MLSARTLGERFERRETAGFDYLRIGLAMFVMLWHTLPLNYGGGIDPRIGVTLTALPLRLGLPAFFALSGFLVASSLERTRALIPFVTARLLRIVPALFVEVTLSALLLGPVLTSAPLSQYFTSRMFFHYFLNIAGDIHYVLPGVFTQNIYPDIVNGSLWTVPFELRCYLALVLIFLVVKPFKPARLTQVLAAALLIGSALMLWHMPAHWNRVPVPGDYLILCFLAGNLIFCLRDRLPSSPVMIAGTLVLSLLLLLTPRSAVLGILPIAYLTALVGCTAPPKNALLRSGDYSYGIYLYAFPMQQTAVLLLGDHRPVQTLLLALCAVCAFAAMSWHVIEKPALRLKSQIGRRFAAARPGPATGPLPPLATPARAESR